MKSSDKTMLRRQFLGQRKGISPEQQAQLSKHVCEKIIELYLYQQAQSIALYQPINKEVDLQALWNHAYQHGKHCYFPSLDEGQTLNFLRATPQSKWVKNRFHILEPDQTRACCNLEEIDIVFMPLVCFDAQCNRVGMGAGYYDRTFAKAKPKVLIGVGYEFQKATHLLPDSWDIPLDMIVTEQNLYKEKS